MYSRQFLDWVLETGEDDEIQFADLAYLLEEDTENADDLVARTVDVALVLIAEGVLVPGDMVDGDFQPWTASSQEIQRRLREGQQQVLRDTGRFLPGDICWFRSTSYQN